MNLHTGQGGVQKRLYLGYDDPIIYFTFAVSTLSFAPRISSRRKARQPPQVVADRPYSFMKTYLLSRLLYRVVQGLLWRLPSDLCVL